MGDGSVGGGVGGGVGEGGGRRMRKSSIARQVSVRTGKWNNARTSGLNADGRSDMQAGGGPRALVHTRVPVLQRWQAHRDGIIGVDLILDPPALVTCSHDRLVKIWSTRGKKLGTLRQGEDATGMSAAAAGPVVNKVREENLCTSQVYQWYRSENVLAGKI